MLTTPPPTGAYSASALPRFGQTVAGINYQNPQGFTTPGAQSDTIMKPGVAQPLQQAPPLSPFTSTGNPGSLGMANALMNPWRA